MATGFSDIYDMFLSKITDYELLKLEEDELKSEFQILLKKSIGKFVSLKDVRLDYDSEEFSRELTPMESDIISNYMVSEWLKPKINNISLLKQSLSSKDFSMYSQANHLKELLELKDKMDKEAQYWSTRYSLIDFTRNGGTQ